MYNIFIKLEIKALKTLLFSNIDNKFITYYKKSTSSM